MSEQTIESNEDLAAAFREGGVYRLLPGTYEAPAYVEASLTLRGEPGTILRSPGSRPVLRVAADDLDVIAEDLTLTGGRFTLGSGVLVEGYSTVTLRRVTVDGNARGEGGGAGVGARRGTVRAQQCRFGAGDDVLFTTVAEGELVGCRVEGDVTVHDGAEVRLEGGEILGTVTVRGTSTRAPTLTLTDTKAANVVNDGLHPGFIVRD